MGNINVALLGEKGYGKELGKKGTESDITFYNLKRGSDTVTMMEPLGYPDKLSSLFYSISLADFAVFVVSDIDAYFGEQLIAAASAGIEKGAFILKNYHTPDEIKPLIRDMPFENYKFFEDDPIKIREFLLEMAGNRKSTEKDKGSVAIDHFFNVKGVGAVVLGTVVSGSIRKHDDLDLLPLNRKVHVRSIQKHDDDFDVASEGDRVGLALKNVESDEIRRGDVLTSEELLMVNEMKIKLFKNKYWNKEIKEGMILHIGHWIQFLPARVENAGELMLALDRPIICNENSRFFIGHLDSGIPRVIGSGSLIQ